MRKRIPTILGLLMLLVSAFVGVLFIDQGTSFLPRANPEHEPLEVMLSNVSDTRFTVSWVTKEPTEGFLLYGTSLNDMKTPVRDERDQLSGEVGQYRTHYVTVTGLEPERVYFAKIGSANDRSFEIDGGPLQILTGPRLATIPTADTAYGQVFWATGAPAEGVLVYVHFGPEVNAGVASGLTKRDGSWVIPIALTRTSALTEYVSYTDSTQLIVTTRTGVESEVVKSIRASEDQPVEPVMVVE